MRSSLDPPETMDVRSVHCALIGDGMVGKTCLTVSYIRDAFMDEYTATIYDLYPVPMELRGERFVISVADTAGQTDFEDLRTCAYKQSDVLLLCFSLCDRESFSNVCNSWLPEVRKHTKGKRPVILVGTQSDMRRDSTGETDFVSFGEGQRLAKHIGADTYVECSAKNGDGLQDVFESVVSSALKGKKRRKGSVFHRIFRRKDVTASACH